MSKVKHAGGRSAGTTKTVRHTTYWHHGSSAHTLARDLDGNGFAQTVHMTGDARARSAQEPTACRQARAAWHLKDCALGWFRPIRRLKWRACDGFSAPEVAAIIAAASLLTAAAKPAVSDYVTSAKAVRATHDARTIATAFVRLAGDVSGAARQEGGLARYSVLVSAGEIPEPGPGGDAAWLASASDRGVSASARGRVGLLQDFLVGSRDTGWRAPTGWRGPYIDDTISPDPWNHRYAVNVETFFKAAGRHETVVLSAGPNGLVETWFTGTGIRAGGDDLVALVSAGGF